ncbi:hypothetical protein LCGC14_0264950 [marine sediment metagenome]|uniref:DUF559 domain-containing protein n=1 Tax=marine sediment metagenome TaxID=412755 RepID=A0A0F9UHU7_9ZZZZ
MELLKTVGFELEEEVSFSPYTVDIYVRSRHIAFEADGPQHSETRDKRRDTYLMAKYALPVYRLDYSELAARSDTETGLIALLWEVLDPERQSALARIEYARESGWE